MFARAVQLIRQDYVDSKKTSYHDLIYAAMKGMLASLDPHSQFMDPNDFKDMQDDTRSRFNGLGIEVSVKNGLLTVITPMEDTPAARAGILSGDQILRINGNSTEKMDLQDAVNVLRGVPGQKVTLTILRPATKEIKDYALERAEIKVQSVKGAKLLDPGAGGPFKIGYVRLIQFNEPTADELAKALDELQKQGMQALVLDLRNNPGRLAQQRGRCLRAISAAEHDGRFDAGPRGLAAERIFDREQREAAAAFSDGGSDQRRQRERRRDRGRRAEGSEPRDSGRRDDLRKRIGAKRDATAGRLGAAIHHGEILHAEQTGDPRAGRRAEHPRPDHCRAGAGAVLRAERGQPEAGRREEPDQDEGPANAARDRCLERRDDLRAGSRAESRRGQEVSVRGELPTAVAESLHLAL